MIDRVIYIYNDSLKKKSNTFQFNLFKVNLTILEIILKSDVTIEVIELIFSIALHKIIIYLF